MIFKSRKKNTIILMVILFTGIVSGTVVFNDSKISFKGIIDMNQNQITNLGTPDSNSDAATIGWVKNNAGGFPKFKINWKTLAKDHEFTAYNNEPYSKGNISVKETAKKGGTAFFRVQGGVSKCKIKGYGVGGTPVCVYYDYDDVGRVILKKNEKIVAENDLSNELVSYDSGYRVPDQEDADEKILKERVTVSKGDVIKAKIVQDEEMEAPDWFETGENPDSFTRIVRLDVQN